MDTSAGFICQIFEGWFGKMIVFNMCDNSVKWFDYMCLWREESFAFFFRCFTMFEKELLFIFLIYIFNLSSVMDNTRKKNKER